MISSLIDIYYQRVKNGTQGIHQTYLHLQM